MSNNFFQSIKSIFTKKANTPELQKNESKRVNVILMEKCFDADDLVGAAVILKHLLEIYGSQKRKNNRLKGREFVYMILSNKHKDLKNVGYKHWQNISKIIYLNQPQPYPYHKQNLRKAMDFFLKELKGIKAIDMELL